MKLIQTLVMGVAIAAASSASVAQFVKGNEAVKVMADGSRKVELAPLPTTGPIKSLKPCAAAEHCNGGPWLMVETKDGLVECTEAYARPRTCRTSTYGTTKLLRLWVVKSDGIWLQCQLPDVTSKCVNMFARPPSNLPYPAAQ
ncbi:MAG: hypothetical protein IV107_04730 [Paucibacter sp.]|nr:hypothetical protein [Roseateles sp.]